MAEFSIIVPVYNVEKEIRKCLDSIKNQTYGDFEVLCVDDCGKDSSMDIVREYAQKDNRFKILTHEHNRGVSAARNTGLDNASGKYTMFVDSDDWLETNALEIIKDNFDKSKSEVIVFNIYNCYPDGKKEINDTTNFKKSNQTQVLLTENNLNTFIGVVWNRAYKTSLINDNHIRFPEGMIIEDSDFTFKISMHIKSVFIIEDVLYNYLRNREGSYTTEDAVNNRIKDEITVISNCWKYAKSLKRERYYRKYFLKLIGTTTKKILGITHKRRYILERIRDLLVEMNFPNDFKDMEKKVLTLWMD